MGRKSIKHVTNTLHKNTVANLKRKNLQIIGKIIIRMTHMTDCDDVTNIPTIITVRTVCHTHTHTLRQRRITSFTAAIQFGFPYHRIIVQRLSPSPTVVVCHINKFNVFLFHLICFVQTYFFFIYSNYYFKEIIFFHERVLEENDALVDYINRNK